jgi:serine/threonine protein phosphatase PrpC
MESSRSNEIPKVTLSVHARTDVGLSRTNNEDAFAIADLSRAQTIEATMHRSVIDVGSYGVLLVVCDGMGGAAFGEVAARLSIEALRNALLDRIQAGPPERAIRESIAIANAAVRDAARSPERKGMGATLAAVLVHGTHAYFTEVGDARTYVVREGRLVQVSRDQSYAQMLIDAGALKVEDLDSFPMKNVVIQAMGATTSVEVPLRRLTLRRGDRLLLCSDGLSGPVSDTTISAVLRRASASSPVDDLIAAANAAGGPDNVTVILADASGDGLPEPATSETVGVELETLHAFSAKELP